MVNQLFRSVFSNNATTFSIETILLCTLASILLGLIIACIYMVNNTYNKGFVITLALMPAMIQMVIMLVNGNLGTGVAVMGAFSLVRFRSVPGTAKEISSIFLAMAIGLATGIGYIGVAVLFVICIGGCQLLLTFSKFGDAKNVDKILKITIPESLDYTEVFDDIFEMYLKKWEMLQVKTCNMGSLYRLEYAISLKQVTDEKEFIDELRCRNGNLEISCSRVGLGREEL